MYNQQKQNECGVTIGSRKFGGPGWVWSPRLCCITIQMLCPIINSIEAQEGVQKVQPVQVVYLLEPNK